MPFFVRDIIKGSIFHLSLAAYIILTHFRTIKDGIKENSFLAVSHVIAFVFKIYGHLSENTDIYQKDRT